MTDAPDYAKLVERLNAEETRLQMLWTFVTSRRDLHEGRAHADLNDIKHAIGGRDACLPEAAAAIAALLHERDEARQWTENAHETLLLTGVGCPACKHEGPYWVVPCRLHARIHQLREDLSVERQIAREQSRALTRICDALEIDPEDDPVGIIADLKAVAESETDARAAALGEAAMVAGRYADDIRSGDYVGVGDDIADDIAAAIRALAKPE